jgi:hypothetical protein
MRVGTPEDAKSIVRKYISGTRSRHGKVALIVIDLEPEGPDEKGVWSVKGMFVTEGGEKEQFAASVTSRGEVFMSNPTVQENRKTTSGLRKR